MLAQPVEGVANQASALLLRFGTVSSSISLSFSVVHYYLRMPAIVHRL